MAKKYTGYFHFSCCDDCIMQRYIDNDYSTEHSECRITNEYITETLHGKKHTYTNKDGILDSCPFVKK